MDKKTTQTRPNLGAIEGPRLAQSFADLITGLRCRLVSIFAAIWSNALEESDRWPLFAPVAIGIGIGSYFAMPVEPGWALAWGLFAFPALGLMVLSRPHLIGIAAASAFRYAAVIFCLFAMMIATGFSAAKIRTSLVESPVIVDLKRPVEVRGNIVGASRQEGGGWRLVIAPSRIESVEPENLPALVRMSVRQKGLSFQPGQRIEIWGRLMPPPDPVSPYAFDFARQSYFRQIGAVGFALGEPEILGPSDKIKAQDQFSVFVAQWRLKLADRVRSHLGGEKGAIAAALMTGDRDLISEETREAMRIAGLAHLLAISGLHMALFGGLVFAVTRFVLAAIEPVAVRYNIKKTSAVIGWIAALLYLILTGASISTQRAFIMISFMFLAVLLDRAALSMRSVTAAGLVILLLSPESLLDVGFQMSFSAVIALIAFYEHQRRRWLLQPNTYQERSRSAQTFRTIWLYLVGIGLTTIVAEVATGPFAAFHFNRVAGYGLVGNLLVMPLVGILIMPCAVVAFLLMPFDLEQFALAPMGWGLDWLLNVSSEVSSWPGAEVYLPSWPTGALVAICLGGLWLAFWQTQWRVFGLAPMAFGVALALTHESPDILIDRDGKNVAVRVSDGELVVLSNRRAKFAADSWARRSGQSAPSETKGRFSCDSEGCIVRDPADPKISYIRAAAIAEEECQRADILISQVPLPRRIRNICRSQILVIDRFDLWRYGAHAIWIRGTHWHVEHAAGVRGNRPWSRSK